VARDAGFGALGAIPDAPWLSAQRQRNAPRWRISLGARARLVESLVTGILDDARILRHMSLA